MTTTHTPGPWNAEWTHRSGHNLEQAKGWHVYSDNEAEPVICNIPDDSRLDGCRYGNALLLAAAPELLEALQKIVANWEAVDPDVQVPDCINQDDDWDAARAAIAKATGNEMARQQ